MFKNIKKRIILIMGFLYKNIYTFLKNAEKNGDITLNNNIDNIVTKWDKYSKLDNFEYMIMNDVSFISEYDKINMREYIQRIKKMGIDTTILDKDLKDFNRYTQIPYDMDKYRFIDDSDNKQLDKLYDEQDKLSDINDRFIKNLKEISKKVKIKLFEKQ